MSIINNKKIDDELIQLYSVANYYYNLAILEEPKVPNSIKNKPIKKFNKKKKFNEAKLRFSAHLDSCAIRLYSIDEKIQDLNKKYNFPNKYNIQIRKKIYDDIVNIKCLKCKQKLPDNQLIKKTFKQKINKDLKDNIDNILHILLRQITAHQEEENKQNDAKVIYKMTQKYLSNNISHNNIYNIIGNLLKKIETELYKELKINKINKIKLI